MRERQPGRLRRSAAAAAVTLAIAIAWSAGCARAADDDDEDVPLDTKLLRQFMKDLGLRRDGQEGIDYRERAPLVVPPTRDLPPPRSEDEVAAKTPAWPKDPDARRRKEATAAERARLKGNFSVEEDMRALRPDELDKPGQFIRIAPLGQLRHVVRANEVKQPRARKTSDVIAKGIDRVGNTAALDFQVVDFAIGLAGQRQSQQTQSLFRRRERQARFERGLRCGNEKEP